MTALGQVTAVCVTLVSQTSRAVPGPAAAGCTAGDLGALNIAGEPSPPIACTLPPTDVDSQPQTIALYTHSHDLFSTALCMHGHAR